MVATLQMSNEPKLSDCLATQKILENQMNGRPRLECNQFWHWNKNDYVGIVERMTMLVRWMMRNVNKRKRIPSRSDKDKGGSWNSLSGQQSPDTLEWKSITNMSLEVI